MDNSRYVKADIFINDQIPFAQRALIPATLEQAYRAANELAKDSPILSVESAKANMGRLRSWAVDLAFQRLIDTGQWQFDYDWAYFQKPTGKYLRIRFESSIMSISYVADSTKPPRKVGFRTNNAFGNPVLSLWSEYDDDIQVEGLPSFILVHGHGSRPQFAHIGLPDPVKQEWLYKAADLMSLPYDATIDPQIPPVEAADEEALLSLKEDIRKWQHDNHSA